MISRRTRGLAAALALAMVPALVGGSAQAHATAEIVEAGRTVGQREKPEAPAQAGTGLAPASSMRARHFVDHADRIEARLCRSFGMTVRLTPGPGESEPRAVLVRVLHPLFTADGGATSTEDDFPSGVVFGQTLAGFSFDHDWELQPGEWTVAVMADGVEIARKAFRITLPPEGQPRSDCEAPAS